jgi:hypothetical protein
MKESTLKQGLSKRRWKKDGEKTNDKINAINAVKTNAVARCKTKVVEKKGKTKREKVS